jgi:hypothetical protein
LGWSDFPDQIWHAVYDFSEGRLLPPMGALNIDHPRISNWASYPGLQKRYPHGVDFGGDWFFEDVNLGPGVVVVDHFGRV